MLVSLSIGLLLAFLARGHLDQGTSGSLFSKTNIKTRHDRISAKGLSARSPVNLFLLLFTIATCLFTLASHWGPGDNGTALQCEVCTGLGNNCTGEMETCPPNHDFCAITMFETEREEIKVHGVVKNCVPSSICEAGFADINLGKKGRSRTSVFCCKGDACNTASSAKLPLLETKLNGLRCPACYASLSESCHEDTVDCVGSESHCIDLAGYVYTGETSEKVAMKGCATRAVCDATVGGAATFTGVSSAITKLECRAATSIASLPPRPAGLVLSAIAGLLMIQLSS